MFNKNILIVLSSFFCFGGLFAAGGYAFTMAQFRAGDKSSDSATAPVPAVDQVRFSWHVDSAEQERILYNAHLCKSASFLHVFSEFNLAAARTVKIKKGTALSDEMIESVMDRMASDYVKVVSYQNDADVLLKTLVIRYIVERNGVSRYHTAPVTPRDKDRASWSKTRDDDTLHGLGVFKSLVAAIQKDLAKKKE